MTNERNNAQQLAIQSHFSNLRGKVISNLEKYLVQFESKFLQIGGELAWAETAEDACLEIGKAISTTGLSFQFENRSRLIKEIGLEAYLEKTGLSKNVNSFNSVKGKPSGSILTGGFLLADSSFVWLPSAHFFDAKGAKLVLLAGIEQILPSVTDLSIAFQIMSDHKTEGIANSVLLSPENIKGCKLILVDNGRSSLLAKPIQSTLLHGFEHFIGLADDQDEGNSIYPGVEGKVFDKYVTSGKSEFAADKEILHGYTKRARLLDVPLRDIIIAELAENAKNEGTESEFGWRTWKNAATSRNFMNKSKIGPFSVMRNFMKRGWSRKREFPKAGKSFNEEWVKSRPTIKKSAKLTDIPKGQLLVRKPATDGRDT